MFLLQQYIDMWETERQLFWQAYRAKQTHSAEAGQPSSHNPMQGMPPPYPSHLRSNKINRFSRQLGELQKQWIARFGTDPRARDYPRS